MKVSLEVAYAEACQTLGETIVAKRILVQELAERDAEIARRDAEMRSVIEEATEITTEDVSSDSSHQQG